MSRRIAIADRMRPMPYRAWSAGLLGMVVVVAPEVLGGATPPTWLAVVIGTSAVCAAIGALMSQEERDFGRMTFSTCALAFAAVWTAVQLLPVPCELMAITHPERAYVQQQLSTFVANAAASCSMTMAPGSTKLALALAVTLTVVSATACALARTGARRYLVDAIGTSSLVSAAVALGHFAFDADLVFGLYRPQNARPGLLLSPLLNGNHLAGHLALGLPVCIAWSLRAKRLELRIVAWFAALLVLCAGLMTLSRGGIAALCLGPAIYFAWFFYTGGERALSVRVYAAIITIITAGMLTGIAIILEEPFQHETFSVAKVADSMRLLQLAYSHPILGVGRGALADLSPQIVDGRQWMLFAENALVQWSVEWGFIAAALIVILLAVGAFRMRIRRSPEIALAAGLIAIAVQNLVDFSLELPGVSVVAAVALGVLSSRETPSRWLPRQNRVRVAILLGSFAVVASSPWALRGSARASVRDAVASATDGAEFAQMFDRALRLYPADPAVLTLSAGHVVNARSPNALGWLNLAMTQAPTWSGPHVLAAEFLKQGGHWDQAGTELALAGDVSLDEWLKSACDLAARAPVAAAIFAAAPRGASRSKALELLAGCVRTRPEAAATFAELWLSEDSAAVVPKLLLIRSAIDSGNSEAAEAAARQLIREQPGAAGAWSALLDLLSRAGRGKEGLALYAQAPTPARFDLRVLQNAIAAAVQARARGELDQLVDELVSRHGTSVELRAELEAFSSEKYQGFGDAFAAITLARRAYAASHTAEHARRLYDAAEAAGQAEVKLQMANVLCQARYEGQQYCNAPHTNPTR